MDTNRKYNYEEIIHYIIKNRATNKETIEKFNLSSHTLLRIKRIATKEQKEQLELIAKQNKSSVKYYEVLEYILKTVKTSDIDFSRKQILPNRLIRKIAKQFDMNSEVVARHLRNLKDKDYDIYLQFKNKKEI